MAGERGVNLPVCSRILQTLRETVEGRRGELRYQSYRRELRVHGSKSTWLDVDRWKRALAGGVAEGGIGELSRDGLSLPE